MNHRMLSLLIICLLSACNTTTEQQSSQEISTSKIVLDTINSTIPTPIAKIGLHSLDYNSDVLFHLFGGIGLWNKDNKIEERCKVLSYTILWKSKNHYGKDTIYHIKGEKSNGRVNEAMELSKTGDNFLFRDIKIICDGDQRNQKAADFMITIQ